MAVYRLEAPLAEAFEAVRGPFAAALGAESRLRLGGGTALGLRWGHRVSTDLDFFVRPGDYDRARDAIAELGAALGGREDVGGLKRAPGGGFECVVGGRTPVSLFPAFSVTRVPVSSDTVDGSGVRLEASTEILAKKLVFRVGVSEVGDKVRRTAPGRDVYDLAYASRYHPEAFEAAAAAVERVVLVRARRHLRQTHPAVITREGRALFGMADEALEFGGRDVVIEALDRHLRDRLPPLPDPARER